MLNNRKVQVVSPITIPPLAITFERLRFVKGDLAHVV